jgi:TP901 family phage tail tape measure protein
MAKFVLTAQLQLRAPTNTRDVIRDLRRQLGGGINIPVEVKGANEAKKQIEKVEKETKKAASAADAMGRSFGLAFKRFAAFTVASRTVSLFTNSLANALSEAIDFQREMIKISQVTNATNKELKSLERTVFNLSKTLGVSSQDLLQVTRVLSQAGYRARELEVALSALAKTTLAPTFTDINATTEGSIAIMAQFKEGVGRLEQQLSSINAVAGQFAVESDDLIGAIRRTGGVFKEAGGQFEEFLGLFTSIRATTRESSESIATGLRTIFTRIQRPRTIEFLRQYGVELQDAEGKFVGTYEAVRRLNEAFGSLGEGDVTFIRVAEEIAGFRQIGKVIPLIKEFELAERARQAAIEGGDSLNKDVVKAQQSLANQYLRVRQEFQALIQSIANTTTFQAFAKTALQLASALIKVADAIKPILPLLGALATFKIAKGLSTFASGVGSAIRGAGSFDPQRKSAGGKILAFARGGFVPGTGNRDTVPAMLSPGEFVVKKSSAEKIGAETLHAMNQNRYAAGGIVTADRAFYGALSEAGQPTKEFKSFLRAEGYLGNVTGKGFGKLDEDRKKKAISDFNKKYPTKEEKEKDKSLLTFGVKQGSVGGFILNPAKGSSSTYTSSRKPFDLEARNSGPTKADKNKTYKAYAKELGIEGGAPISAELEATSFKMLFPGMTDKNKESFKKNAAYGKILNKAVESGLTAAINSTVLQVKESKALNLGSLKADETLIARSLPPMLEDNSMTETMEGYIFEGMISALTGSVAAGGQEFFDFPDLKQDKSSKKQLKAIFPAASDELRAAEAKRGESKFKDTEKGIQPKVLNTIAAGQLTDIISTEFQQQGQLFALGGIVQRFLNGGKAEVQRGAYVFDFDDTLATTEAKGFKDFNDPSFIQKAVATRYAKLAKRRASQGDDIHVLTARFASQGIIQAINDFMARNSIPTKSVMAVGGAFKNEREPGKKPGTTRKLGTASKKAKILAKLAKNYSKITFLDDNLENLLKAGEVEGVTPVEAEASKLFKKYAKGGPATDKVPALLTPGEYVLNKGAAESIGYGNLNSMNKTGVARFAKGGPVQRFANGGPVGGGGGGLDPAKLVIFSTVLSLVNQKIQQFGTSADGTRNALGRVTDVLTKYAVTIGTIITAYLAFTGKQLTLSDVINKAKDPVQAFKDGLEATKKVIDSMTEAAQKAVDGFEAGASGEYKTEEQTRTKYFNKNDEEVFKTKTKSGDTTFRKKDEEGNFTGGYYQEKNLTTRKEKTGTTLIKDTQTGRYATPKGISGKDISAKDPISQASVKAGAAFNELRAKTKQLTNQSKQLASQGFSSVQSRLSSLLPVYVQEKLAILAGIAARAKEQLMQSKFGQGLLKGLDGLKKGFSEAGKGFSFKAKGGKFDAAGRGRDARGRFASTGKGLGGKLGRAGGSVAGKAASLATKIPGVGSLVSTATGAASAASAAGAGAGAAAAAGLASVAGVATGVVAGMKLLTDVTLALIGAQQKAQDAIKKGEVAQAGYYSSMTGASSLFGAGAAAFTESIANIGGPITSFTDSLGLTEGANDAFYSGLATISSYMQGDFSGTLRALGESQALAAKAAREYADNTRIAAGAMEDIQSGDRTASDAFKDLSGNFQNMAASFKGAQAADETKGSISAGASSVVRDALAYTAGFVLNIETSSQKNERISNTTSNLKEQKQKFEQEFDSLKPGFDALGKELILNGGSLEDYKKELEAQGVTAVATDKQMEILAKNFERQQKAIDKNIKFIEALNFGLRDAAAAADAMAVRMNSAASAGEAGFNTFSDSATLLETAMTSAGQNISATEMDGAIADLESSLRQFGAGDKEIANATGTVRGIQQAQANVPAALEATKTDLIQSQDLSDANIKDVLGKNLLKGVEGPAKDKLEAAIDKMQIDDTMRAEIRAGKLDKVLEQTLDPVAKAAGEQAIAQVKKRAEMENQLISATQKRIAQEQEYIAAQKSAIETQLEAGRLFEEFGGAKLTSDQQLSARTAQANLDLQNAGVGGLQSGGVQDIRRAADEIRARSAAQNDRANAAVAGRATGQSTGGAFAGAAGVDEDKRDELKQANKALVEFTKQRITLIQEELKIAEQKNKAEKDALDKLLGGDIEGFLEGQLAATAGAALRTGDASLAGAFGAGALGAGYQTLEGQGLSGQQMQQAAALSLSSVGVSDPRSAQVLSGTTSEQEALKAEGRDLAATLGDLGQQSADLEKMDVNAAEVVINAQRMIMDSELNKDQATGMMRGGPVYANRGMFVPRGTDTVPAMLTPGEFVVNRAAVQRGNNLALLQAMNGGMGAPGGMGMSRGGMVYMAGGGLLEKVYAAQRSMVGGAADMMGMGDFGEKLTDGMKTVQDGFLNNVVDPLKKVFDNSPMSMFANQFQESVQKLMDFQLNVKVDPTNVNVNFNGASVLQGLSDSIKKELLEKVREELKNGKFNESGEFTSKPGM